MALTREEIDEAYTSLIEAAKANGLDWVVEQTESQIALGKIRMGKVRAKDVPLRSTPEDQAEWMSKGRPAKFTVSDEYSPQERLQALIEALEQTVCGIWQTAEAVSHFLTGNIPNLSGIKFMPDGISKEPFALEKQEIHAKRGAVEHFQVLIRELKENI